MLRILQLKIRNHKVLKDIDLDFSNNILETEKPYTTLIIGTNGTGKSFILRAITDIFRLLEIKKNDKTTNINVGKFFIKYIINQNTYTYTNDIVLFKDEIIEKNYITQNGLTISLKELELPKHLIVNSIMLNDRFPMINSGQDDMYQYLGIRRSGSQASTKTPIRRTIQNLIEASGRWNFLPFVEGIIKNMLNYSSSLTIYYRVRYGKLFFNNRDLDFQSLEKIYSDNPEEFKEFLPRRKNAHWGSHYFHKIKDDKLLIENILHFLNNIEIINRKNKGQFVKFDFFKENARLIEERDIIKHLTNLNLLEAPEIALSNFETEIEIENLSSGEFHFLVSLFNLITKLDTNSLVLIDEPEISLHPNWQMQYIHNLKKALIDFSSCHFIIASHSHFLVSDLEPQNSSIIVLQRNTENRNIEAELYDHSTYAWSAENVLYNVFKVRTVRNFYFEQDLRELLSLISEKSNAKDKITHLLNKFENLSFNQTDPINIVLTQAKEYLKQC